MILFIPYVPRISLIASANTVGCFFIRAEGARKFCVFFVRSDKSWLKMPSPKSPDPGASPRIFEWGGQVVGSSGGDRGGGGGSRRKKRGQNFLKDPDSNFPLS